jgi:lipopolysaccharide transport system ATP-binding protein
MTFKHLFSPASAEPSPAGSAASEAPITPVAASPATIPSPEQAGPVISPANSPQPALVAVPDRCTLFHVTHAKAGSQWIRAILEDLFGAATLPPEYHGRQVWGRPIELGRVYTCFHVGKPEFDALPMPGEARPMVLVRDLRDTLVSAYFSLRNSHENKTNELDYYRSLLGHLNREEGLLFLAETWLGRAAWIQRTWLASGVLCYKVEDCFADPPRVLARLINESWRLNLEPEALQAVTNRHSFKDLIGGRPPGSEDPHSHYRRGVGGDWVNQFTPRLARRFEYLYNDVLLLAGYISQAGWSEQVGGGLPAAA